MLKVEFITDLVTRRAPPGHHTPWLKGNGPRRQLVEDFLVKVRHLGGHEDDIAVPEGYIFDGASIPAPLWWAFPPGYDPAWRAAAVHDYIYSHLWEIYSKDYADRIFRDAMRADGAHPAVVWAFYNAVKTFGKGWWND